MLSKALIIPAAGAGVRMQRELPKPYITLGDQTILAHTLRRFRALQGLAQVVIATSADFIKKAETILSGVFSDNIAWQVVEGGAERQHSIHNALQTVSDVELVLVHDAVRPFILLSQIKQCCEEAADSGAAILGIPSKDTIKKVDENGFVASTPDRSKLWQVQTPQVFKTALLKRAYAKAAKENYLGTDDASLVEWLGEPVKLVQGSTRNIKLTYPQDLKIAELFMGQDYD